MSQDKIAIKLTRARANLIMAQPFFGSLALKLKIEPDEKVETSVTDGLRVRYNPKYVENMTLDQTQGMLAHVVMHSAFLHHTRRGGRDVKKWNEACDYSVNTILKEAKFELPEDKFCDPKYNGMTAEHIYTLLPDKPSGKGPGKDQNGSGEGEGNDPGGNGGVEDSPNSQNKGASTSQQQAEEAEWKQAVAQAAHVARQAGALPASLERMMQELMEPIVPWKNILRRFMTEKAPDDFSWSRGNRRFIAGGLYLPSRQSQDAMDTMVVAIDTSGSIGEKELTEFGSEIAEIHREVRPKKLVVIYCDAQVNHVDEFGPDDELFFKLHGGGGTDFRPPFHYMDEHNIAPKCFVYLTDGYGPFPETEPEFPNLWCINNFDVTPPYGEHLTMVA